MPDFFHGNPVKLGSDLSNLGTDFIPKYPWSRSE